MGNYGHPLKKHTELCALFWENVVDIAGRAKDVQKLFDDFVAFSESSFALQEYEYFSSILQNYG